MSDQYDEQAAKLLPCTSGTDLECNASSRSKCESCRRRPAVAAALREHKAEVERLRAEIERAQNYNAQSMYERDDLRAKLAEAEKERGEYKAAWARRGEALLRPCISCGYQTVNTFAITK